MATESPHHLYDAPSLEAKASWISFILFGFLEELFATGYKRTLEDADLGGISDSDRSDVLIGVFRKEYEKECASKKPNKRSLWVVLWRTVGLWRLILALALFCLSAGLQFGPVAILTRLVRHLQRVETYDTVGLWVMISLLFVFPVVGSIALAHSNTIMAHLGAQVRNILICSIYRKSLTISPYRKQEFNSGRIVTMFSDDTSQIRAFLFFLTNSVCAPLQVGACLYLIYEQVGAATFVGLGYTFFSTPIAGIVFGIVFKMRKEKMKFTDMRVKLMNECLNGIRVLKYYAWELPLMEKIKAIRESEISIVARMGYLFNFVFGLLLLSATQIQTVLIFLTYVAQGNQLDAAKSFTALTLFGLMTAPFIFLPYGLQQYNQSVVSMNRIMQFLDCEDIEQYITQTDSPSPSSSSSGDGVVVIEFKQACMGWSPEEEVSVNVATQGTTTATKDGKTYTVPPSDTKAEAEAAAAAAEDSVPITPTVDDDHSNRAFHTLRDLNIQIKRGQLCAIVGSVGSGKSSLLSALLGEMVLRSGEVIITNKNDESTGNKSTPPSIAYCDQRPWIVNATVKQNITFGKPFDEDKMNKAISAACMEDDMKILDAGLETEIGERGINLSGGQKARVALARAVYNDADVILLDDVLSAVDAHVGQYLIEHCILGALSGKTRLLVTHNLNVLPSCDLIIIIDTDGTVKAQGSYQDITSSGLDVENYIGKGKIEEVEKEEVVSLGSAKPLDKTEKKESGPKNAGAATAEKDNDKEEKKKAGALTTQEEKKEGSVSWATYFSYAQYGGLFPFFLVVFFQLGSQVLSIEANFWLSDWGQETSVNNFIYRRDLPTERVWFWFHGYAGMQMASIGCLLISRIALNYHRTFASITYHNKLLSTVLFLPVSFFDVTPIGRIINRFSQDIATIDEELVQSISQVIGMGGGVCGSLGAIAGSTKGAFLLLFIPLAIIYSRFLSYFRSTNTAIARLESVSRSPIYADFSQVLGGTSTIRAYAEQQRYILKLEDYANRNTVPGVLQQVVGQWLAIRLDILGSLVMFFMGALTVALQNSNEGFVPAGYLALGLSYAIQLTSLLKLSVRSLSTLEAQFNSVERVRYYSELEGVEGQDQDQGREIPGSASSTAVTPASTSKSIDGDVEMQTPLARLPTSAPPSDWPSAGKIVFENVSLRYRDGPLVLKNVSFEVASRDKIGIAGRTGCGKSSLMVALFHIEPLCGGRILIDDIDIATIPLQTLRSKIAIIPQESTLFSATVLFNLDPFQQHSEEEVWEVLKAVKLYEHIMSLPNKLQEMVAEGGDNFSGGQRQLVCIARAILRKPAVLVLDEATASIDSETDEFIQAMIRTKFVDCTVLTIAHRLGTIIDSSNVLIMDKGVAGEFGPPQELLARDDGLFKGLWDRHVGAGGGH